MQGPGNTCVLQSLSTLICLMLSWEHTGGEQNPQQRWEENSLSLETGASSFLPHSLAHLTPDVSFQAIDLHTFRSSFPSESPTNG